MTDSVSVLDTVIVGEGWVTVTDSVIVSETVIVGEG